MGLKFRQKTAFFLFWPAVLIYLVTSCVSAGSSNFSAKNTKKIISGKTTKKEIVEVLGEPEQVLKLDKEGLETYLSRVGVSDTNVPGNLLRFSWKFKLLRKEHEKNN